MAGLTGVLVLAPDPDRGQSASPSDDGDCGAQYAAGMVRAGLNYELGVGLDGRAGTERGRALALVSASSSAPDAPGREPPAPTEQRRFSWYQDLDTSASARCVAGGKRPLGASARHMDLKPPECSLFNWRR